jgi:hypothetical protein
MKIYGEVGRLQDAFLSLLGMKRDVPLSKLFLVINLKARKQP